MAKKQPEEKPDRRRKSVSDRVDERLVKQAIQKIARGETPTRDERTALRRHEKRQEEERRWEYYESIPQKHWREMGGGRTTQQLKDQALRYNLPIGGATISLPAFVKRFHEFLAENARAIQMGHRREESGDAKDSIAKERARILELKRLETERQLVPVHEVRSEILAPLAEQLRLVGQQLQRRYGNEAVDMLNEAIEDVANAIGNLETGEPQAKA